MAWSSEIQAIIDREFPSHTHPYRILERTILEYVRPDAAVLDIGCGRQAPNLMKLKGRARTLIGIDTVDFEVSAQGLALLNESALDMTSIASGTVDVAYSRSVMEHLDTVDAVYAEIHRVLKPCGKYIFLTPNFWDYTSLISYVIPNFLHGKLMKFVEGRTERDTFPTFYRSNPYYRIRRNSSKYRFAIQSFQYLGQYPSAFLFNDLMFRAAVRYEKFLGRHERLQFLRGWILCVLSKIA